MGVNMFVFAVGLSRRDSSCDYIVGATGGGASFTWIETPFDDMFTSYARDHMSPHFVVFGVLGEAQHEYFRSILSKGYKIVDVAKCIPPYIDYLKPRNAAYVQFQFARLEMLKSVIRTLRVTTSSTADWVIPEKRVSENPTDDKYYLPEKIEKIDVFANAFFGSEKTFDSIAVVSAGGITRTFERRSDFVEFAKNGVGVFGQAEFFESLLEPEVEVIDLLGCIPKDINFICLNADHAIYHAKRIEYFNNVCLENRETLIEGLTPPPIGMEYRKPYVYLKRSRPTIWSETDPVENKLCVKNALKRLF